MAAETNNRRRGADEVGDCQSYDWRSYLKQHPDTDGVSPSCFPHVSLNVDWDSICCLGQKDLMVVVRMREGIECQKDPAQYSKFWTASVKKFCGYLAKVQYLGGELLPSDESEELSCRWANIVSGIRPVDYVECHSKCILIPPKFWKRDIFDNIMWFEYLETKHASMKSIPPGLSVAKYQYNDKLFIGQIVEVLDRGCLSMMRLGFVVNLIGGRVHVRYWNSRSTSGGFDFACHERSDWIRPCGFSNAIGLEISAPEGYDMEMEESEILSMVDSTRTNTVPPISINEGMKLEAVDLHRRALITSAYVRKVLKHGYILVSNDHCTENFNHQPTFYHYSSPLIFPCGFCQEWNISLATPWDCDDHSFSEDDDSNMNLFSWNDYFSNTQTVPLPITKLREEIKNHEFKTGMKLEAMGLLEGDQICPAIVKGVYGRLLRITFIGWQDQFDQWMDVKSPELYPVGWCKLNGYKLQRPGGSKNP